MEEKLAVCVNRISGLASVYEWEGKIQEEPESLLIVKTSASVLEKTLAWMRENHSYTVPELAVIDSLSVNFDYLQWLRDYVEKS